MKRKKSPRAQLRAKGTERNRELLPRGKPGPIGFSTTWMRGSAKFVLLVFRIAEDQ